MNKTEASQFIESVSGCIVGDHHSTGQIFHEGRPQSGHFNGTTDADIREQAKAHVVTLKARLGPEFARLYPNGLELRIWD